MNKDKSTIERPMIIRKRQHEYEYFDDAKRREIGYTRPILKHYENAPIRFDFVQK